MTSIPAALAWFVAGASVRVIRRSLTTGPAFWDRPVWSRPRTWRPAIIAAVPRIWLTVTTPVPPIPVIRTVNTVPSTSGSETSGASGGGVSGGVGQVGSSAVPARAGSGSATVTVAKDGQSPFMHDRSKLQLVWWIRVLRPHAVSTGCTDRHPLTSPQSPHPSHTRSLMTTRKPGVGMRPLDRARRCSAAQAWSWRSTVTPGTSASSRCASSKRSRCHTSTPTGSSCGSWRPGSSLVTITRLTPSNRSDLTTSGTDIWPSGSWPPVIATVPL